MNMKNLIKTYPYLSYVRINGVFVRKENITFIDPVVQKIHIPGCEFRLTNTEFKRVVEELGFNEKSSYHRKT